MNIKLEKAKEILGDLIGFDTTSHLSNIPIIDYIDTYLKGFGLEPARIPNEDGEKECLYVTIGPKKAGGICFSGHTDVVPVEGQDWDTDPFSMTEKDGKLYGRGTCDMKGYIACCLAMVPDLVKMDLQEPFHMIFSYDEEIGCEGVLPTIDRFKEDLHRPDVVIVGEPSMMDVVNAHKSLNTYKVVIRGLEAHSSLPDTGSNAIFAATEIIHHIMGMAEEWKKRGDTSGLYHPPYTTIHVGVIKGGTEQNIIPGHCEFEWEFRGLPTEIDDDVKGPVATFINETMIPKYVTPFEQASIETQILSEVPAFEPEPDGLAEAIAKRAAGKNSTCVVSYGTEAGQFQNDGISTIICGPGSIEQAHKANEFVAISQLDSCLDFLDRVIAEN